MTQDMISDSSPTHPTATIHLDNIVANWKALGKLSGKAETGAVVKANAYGLGMDQVARALSKAGCQTFFVAHIEEAVQLREALGSTSDIILFHGVHTQSLKPILANRITPVLNSIPQIALWNEAETDQPACLHIDTGMNRLGLQMSEVDDAKNSLASSNIAMVMSHLACADEPGHALNAHQLTRFQTIKAHWPEATASLCNSSGISLGPDYTFDLTRPGIGLYGGGSSAHYTPKHAVTVAAPILSIFEPDNTQPSASIGYGATARTYQGQKLATIALGYADGALRSLANTGFAYVHGTQCPIVGRTSMDLITLDITNAPSKTSCMDTVEFLGQHAHLEEQAAAAGTLAYELLTCIGPRVRRLYDGF